MPVNHHGSLVIAGDRGVLITGASGAGKTALALALLGHCASHGVFTRLVSDDQVFLAEGSGRLVGRAAPGIDGLVEAHGFGPAPIAHESAAVVDLLVRLVPNDTAPRLREDDTAVVEGVSLACLDLAERNTEGALMAVLAQLSLPPFG